MAIDFNQRLKPATRLRFGALRALHAAGVLKLLAPLIFSQLPKLGERWARVTFKGVEPSERDVFVAVYPKAGNNWTMQIAIQIAHRGAAEFEHIHELVCWPHSPVPELIAPMDSPAHERSPTKLRVIKTQLPLPGTPYNDRGRYLVVVRDPRDTLVSMHHFLNGVIGGIIDQQFSIEDLHQFILDERMPVCWAEHAAGWWALREQPNVMLATFREMKRDLGGVVSRAAEVMGVALTEAEHAEVVRRSSFAYMKAHEDQFAPPIPTYRGEQAKMIRSGEVGGGKVELTQAQRDALDVHYKAKLKALGSDLPYDALFNSD